MHCHAQAPSNVVLSGINIFVCMNCSGIHREFHHSVKSVSMTTFSKEEYEALKDGGNEVSKSKYLQRWQGKLFAAPQPNEIEKIREFIRTCLVCVCVCVCVCQLGVGRWDVIGARADVCMRCHQD